MLGVSRSSVYYEPRGLSEEDEELMKKIDRIYMKYPFKGSRRVALALWDIYEERVGRKRVGKLMGDMGISGLSPGAKTTKRGKESKIYPYLLRGKKIEEANQVWACDITYIPMRKGFLYLAVVMDWYSRRVLSHSLSNTMDSDFCVEALEEALSRYGVPEIFNTDQGSQFTSEAFTGVLLSRGISISMDGKGSWRDNVFVERLWRSLKYEEVYLRAYDSVGDAKSGIGGWIGFYNKVRRHQGLGSRTPQQVYYGLDSGLPKEAA